MSSFKFSSVELSCVAINTPFSDLAKYTMTRSGLSATDELVVLLINL